MYDKRHNTVREAGRDLWITDFSDLGRKEKKSFIGKGDSCGKPISLKTEKIKERNKKILRFQRKQNPCCSSRKIIALRLK